MVRKDYPPLRSCIPKLKSTRFTPSALLISIKKTALQAISKLLAGIQGRVMEPEQFETDIKFLLYVVVVVMNLIILISLFSFHIAITIEIRLSGNFSFWIIFSGALIFYGKIKTLVLNFRTRVINKNTHVVPPKL